MNKTSTLITALFAVLFVLTGCGGGGNNPANLFAGPKYVGFYDEDGSNSSWGGTCEVIVKQNGQFEPNGAFYTSSFGDGDGRAADGQITSKTLHDEIVQALSNGENPSQVTRGGGGGGGYTSHEGTVMNGSISNDGTVHYEAKVTLDATNWPSTPLAEPYLVIADGHVTRHGFDWKGTGRLRYYEMNPDGSRGALSKDIPYDFRVMNGPS